MKKIFRVFTLLILCFCLSLQVFALSLPKRPDNRYVLDESNVLTTDLENHIIRKNESLFSRTGAEIVVAVVDYISGDDMEEYTMDMYDEWGIGSKERYNGLLLVLALHEGDGGDYYAVPGYGLKSVFTPPSLKDLFKKNLEADFSQGNYDSGVNKFFDDVYEIIENYYKTYTDEYNNFTTGGATSKQSSDVGWVFSNFLRVIVILLIVIVIIAFISRNRGGGGYGGGNGGGGGGFWNGMFWGSVIGNRRHHHHGYHPHGGHYHRPPPRGGYGHNPHGGGFSGGSGGFTRGGGRPSSGAGRSGSSGRSGGGFSGGGGRPSGGAGRGGAGRR